MFRECHLHIAQVLKQQTYEQSMNTAVDHCHLNPITLDNGIVKINGTQARFVHEVHLMHKQ